MNYKNIIIIFLFLISIITIPSAYALIPNESMKIFAVSDNEAMVATLNVSIVEGTGKIFSSIDESLVGSATQESVKNAVKTTYDVVGNSIKNKYNFTIDIESSAYSIDGPSAGGAIALLMISMFEDVNLSQEIGMTGSITVDGLIGDVGGIYFKAKKAAEVGVKIFLIPAGNRKQIISEDGEIKDIDLVDYAYQNWGMKIVEVSDIKEVVKYSRMQFSDIDINATKPIIKDTFTPEKIKYSSAIKPMKSLVNKYIVDANTEINKIKYGMDSNSIKDLGILQSMLGIFDYAREGLDNSITYNENNFLYSSANSAFLTFLNITTVNEIIANPSVLSLNSTIFDLRVQNLENKINLTKNRLKLCSLDNFEWCIGAKQRLTWAEDKLEKIKSTNYSKPGSSLLKISDYSYAVGWVDIANDFLNIGITDSSLKFVESNHFKNLAQESIISVENELILLNSDLSNDEDFLRRLNAAKMNYKRGWYVTSLYDSATAMSVLVSDNESFQDLFNISSFEEKYDFLNKNLRSTSGLNSEKNVWSKLYFDHSIYYYTGYKYYKDKGNDIEADSYIRTANSIVNIAYYLYEVEEKVISYYDDADIQIIIEDLNNNSEVIVEDNLGNTSQNYNDASVYVYSKENSESNNLYLYVLVIGIFIILISFAIEFNSFRKNHTSQGLLKQISYLDEQLLEGKISPFTYNEMRSKYLNELNLIKEKENKKELQSKKIKATEISSQNLNISLEEKIIDKQIEELKKRKKELGRKNSKSKKKPSKKK
ncbi:hypothetical protein M0Q39_06595 [Patescibacteria group bacterium]|nr:hypothetical protein [Patescibacteria group bacterium]